MRARQCVCSLSVRACAFRHGRGDGPGADGQAREGPAAADGRATEAQCPIGRGAASGVRAIFGRARPGPALCRSII